MKRLKLLVVALILFAFGCGGKPVSTEIKDVCKQPIGTTVEITGYISLPKQLTTLNRMRGAGVTGIGWQIFMMTKQDASGDAVMSTFWSKPNYEGEPNQIKPLPLNGYTWNDLLVYTNDGKTATAGKLLKITGPTVSEQKFGCYVDVKKIEIP